MRARARDLPTLREVTRVHIERVLETTGGNKTRAAKILGVDRRTLIRHGYRRERRAETA